MEVLISAADSAIDRRFKRFAHNTNNMTEAFAKVTVSLAEVNRRNWGKGVELADSTIEQKAAAGRPDPLVWTGNLKKSLTEVTGGGDAIRFIGAHEMRFGTSLFYARFQQHGTKNMHKHRVLRFTITTKRLIHNILHAHLHA